MNCTVLHFLCGENTAVGSAALTVRRTVIHYRLTLRVIRPRAHTPRSVTAKIKATLKKNGFFGREVDNGFDQNPHKHYIFKASAHGLNAEKAEISV